MHRLGHTGGQALDVEALAREREAQADLAELAHDLEQELLGGSTVPVPTEPTSDELLAAYFLSRCGPDDDPPPQLEVGNWADAYSAFYDSSSGGRTESDFRNSLKNARDTFDAFVDNSRKGHADGDAPPPAFATVLSDRANQSDAELWASVAPLVADHQS